MLVSFILTVHYYFCFSLSVGKLRGASLEQLEVIFREIGSSTHWTECNLIRMIMNFWGFFFHSSVPILSLLGSFAHVFVFSLICFFFAFTFIMADNGIHSDGAKFISEGMKENEVITNLKLEGMFNIYFSFSQALVSRSFFHFISIVCFLIFSFL